VFNQRQIQDVGTLTQSLEIPERWFDGVIWQLARYLAFEIPQVDAAWVPNVVAMADKALLEVERGESDGAPIMVAPNISGYTR
jgi:hypothetical protein